MSTPITALIPRLPVVVRKFHGEDVASFARRLAKSNETTVAECERAARSTGFALSTAYDTEQRRELWRLLGGLPPEAFCEPKVLSGSNVADRALCLRCCAGQKARGRLPNVGLVCLKHRWWIGDVQRDIRALPELSAAERQFRRVLVPRGILVATQTFNTVSRAAAHLPETLLRARANRLNAPQVTRELLIYPEIVALTCLITHPAFGNLVLTQAPRSERHQLVFEAIAKTLNWVDLDELWGVINPLWQLLNLEYDWVTAAKLRGAIPTDGQWNLLRCWDETAQNI